MDVDKGVAGHTPIVKSGLWSTEVATRTFANSFAKALQAQPAPRSVFVELRGDLGAGKTTLVRHLLRALGVMGRVKSPTYAVVEPYSVGLTNDAGGAMLPIWHFDFYRFSDPREWEDAGFREIFAGPGLKLAEWPDNVAGQLPASDLAIQIDVLPDETRRVTLTARSGPGLALLNACALREDLA
jgi:tRNA threonylcarbamoyladenosine biosynthesis protein TsaE